jgi:Ras-related protein Rab-32
MYIRGALGCIVVTDIMKPETMESGALDWKSLIETQADPLIDGKTIPIVLFGNKVDLIQNKTLIGDQTQNLKSFVKKHGFDGGFLTSAKENVNLQEAFNYLTQIIVTRHLSKADLDSQGGFDSGNNRPVSLKNSPEPATTGTNTKSGCC